MLVTCRIPAVDQVHGVVGHLFRDSGRQEALALLGQHFVGIRLARSEIVTHALCLDLLFAFDEERITVFRPDRVEGECGVDDAAVYAHLDPFGL